MTAKKAQMSTMILLVVPLGFSTGTELLKTMAHRSHTDLPMVNVEPPASEREDKTRRDCQDGRKKGAMRANGRRNNVESSNQRGGAKPSENRAAAQAKCMKIRNDCRCNFCSVVLS